MKAFPSSIYRLQLNQDFPLKKAIEVLPYLKSLGVEGVYCSPFFAARSPHGYDIVDPNRLNPQIGTEKQFAQFCHTLKKLDLYHIADVVPNHMGILGENPWFQDVLEKGKQSAYAPFFDIDWTEEKISVPILPLPYEETLKKGAFSVICRKNKPYLKYADLLFPIRQRLKSLPKTPREIDCLLQTQHYSLVHWLQSNHTASYRRFFNIAELIGLKMENAKVFAAHHQWVFTLLKQKKIDGLRIDHPDGLLLPHAYLKEIRKNHKGLVVVEKILGFNEPLPSWPVEGTVGYEYLNRLTGFFVKKEEALTKIWAECTGEDTDFSRMLYKNKLLFIRTEMQADVEKLCRLIKETSVEAVIHLLAAFPVYRTYFTPDKGLPPNEQEHIQTAFQVAKKNTPVCFKMLETIFMRPQKKETEIEFILKFQQLSAPIMAKGFEDITLYQYNRLLALNEVGGAPQRHGVTAEEYHAFCQEKQEKWPYGFLTDSTHDTKRSADARLQIAVLSEIPNEWQKTVETLYKVTDKERSLVGKDRFPDPNAQYHLFQTLIGVWSSRPSFDRLWTCFQKSIREARAYTSWRAPHSEYENACKTYLKKILHRDHPFRKIFIDFHKKIEGWGRLNSLSASALKLASPGIVEIYQGCENNRYLMVDPDNRSQVKHFGIKTTKARLHAKALHFRSGNHTLFLKGAYQPLQVKGREKEHVIAFMRISGNQVLVVAVMRFFAHFNGFSDTVIELPKGLGKGADIFTNRKTDESALLASWIFAKKPYAWLTYQT